mmetsp:Transcript_97797/g.273772  ORF Transcript_97797/g.273772 Transcript_97797/m.273772 type:complete len:241 (-) Transcript_97797:1086-1808(-)
MATPPENAFVSPCCARRFARLSRSACVSPCEARRPPERLLHRCGHAASKRVRVTESVARARRRHEFPRESSSEAPRPPQRLCRGHKASEPVRGVTMQAGAAPPAGTGSARVPWATGRAPCGTPPLPLEGHAARRLRARAAGAATVAAQRPGGRCASRGTGPASTAAGPPSPHRSGAPAAPPGARGDSARLRPCTRSRRRSSRARPPAGARGSSCARCRWSGTATSTPAAWSPPPRRPALW